MLRDVTSVALAGAEMDARWARQELRRRYLFPSEAELDSEGNARPSGEAPRALVQGSPAVSRARQVLEPSHPPLSCASAFCGEPF